MIDKEKRAHKAKLLLEDEMVNEALNEMKGACYHNIVTSHPDNVNEREDLYYMSRCIEKFKEILIRFVNEGKKANIAPNIKQLKR